MSYIDTVVRHKGEIVASARLAIIMGIRQAWQNCSPKEPYEPDLVAGLTLYSTKILFNAWGPIFKANRISFSLASVYCHQTPQVKYPNMGTSRSCELGDIMFVHLHTNVRKECLRNALLYQVKCSSKQPYSLKSKEIDQLKLYEEWPKFEYVRSGRLNGQKRDVVPKLPHTGAQYLLIDDRPPSDPLSGLLNFPATYPIGSCMASRTLHDHNSLEGELFDFLLFKSGRQFEDRNRNQSLDGWSTVVWDLLAKSLNKGFTRRRSGLRGRPRVSSKDLDSTLIAFSTPGHSYSLASEVLGGNNAQRIYSSEFQGNGQTPPPNRDFNEFDEEGGSVSVIILETSEASYE